MYYYILDGQNIEPAHFEQKQIALQSYLAEFKLSGEMARVTSLRSIADLVETASNRGVKTLVACGNDATFNLMLSYIKGRDFTLSFIPLDQESYLSKILGLPDLYTAVKTLAARRIEKIDLALMNESYFVSYVEFGITANKLKSLGWISSIKAFSAPSHQIKIKIDESYTMEINCLGGIIANTRSTSSNDQTIANPTDGFLDLLIVERLARVNTLKYKKEIINGSLEQIPGTSVIKCKKIEFLEPTGFPLTISGRVFAKAPANIEIIPRKLRLIVGKSRTF